MNFRGARPWLGVLSLLWLAVLVVGMVFAVRSLASPAASVAYYAEEQARAGHFSYAQHCASCHGPALTGVSAPALVGEEFWEGWEGRSVQELYSYIHDKMPLGRGGSLSPETYAESTAYLLEQNGLPAGERALAPGSSRLADLRLEPALVHEPVAAPEPRATAARGPDFFSYLQAGATLAAPLVSDHSTPLYLAQASGQDAEESVEDADENGAELFARNCASCHGQKGEGGTGPALAENSSLEDAQAVIVQILEGGGGMPAFGDDFSDAEVAAVASHIRTSWDNDFGEVDAEQVAEARDEAGEDEPETEEDARAESEDRDAEGQSEDADDEGEEAEDEAARAAGGAVPEPVQASAEELGPWVYARHCAACHGAEGEGGIGLPLAGNERMEDGVWTVRRILVGANAMPAFGVELSVEEVAAVTSYLRSNWGNAYPEVDSALVAQVAAGLPGSQLNPVAVNLADAPRGQQLYTSVCAACHGLQGGGDVGPPLAGNTNLDNTQLVVTTLLYGRGLMPAFDSYSDDALADIASYIRESWSNAFGPVMPEEVRGYRADRNREEKP